MALETKSVVLLIVGILGSVALLCGLVIAIVLLFKNRRAKGMQQSVQTPIAPASKPTFSTEWVTQEKVEGPAKFQVFGHPQQDEAVQSAAPRKSEGRIRRGMSRGNIHGETDGRLEMRENAEENEKKSWCRVGGKGDEKCVAWQEQRSDLANSARLLKRSDSAEGLSTCLKVVEEADCDKCLEFCEAFRKHEAMLRDVSVKDTKYLHFS